MVQRRNVVVGRACLHLMRSVFKEPYDKREERGYNSGWDPVVNRSKNGVDGIPMKSYHKPDEDAYAEQGTWSAIQWMRRMCICGIL